MWWHGEEVEEVEEAEGEAWCLEEKPVYIRYEMVSSKSGKWR